MILGVSDWLSPKVNIKAAHLRIGFLLLAVFVGIGIGLYLVAWIVKILEESRR